MGPSSRARRDARLFFHSALLFANLGRWAAPTGDMEDIEANISSKEPGMPSKHPRYQNFRSFMTQKLWPYVKENWWDAVLMTAVGAVSLGFWWAKPNPRRVFPIHRSDQDPYVALPHLV